MATVYLETTIPSYLAARPSRDLIVAAHQQITHDGWRSAKDRFDLYIAEAVLLESRQGDPDAVQRRMAIIKGLPVLAVTEDVQALVATYDQRLGFPARARADLPHIAFAVAYEIDYLVTWNCAHIANGEVIRRLQILNSEMGRVTPVMVTPEELLEPPRGQEA